MKKNWLRKKRNNPVFLEHVRGFVRCENVSGSEARGELGAAPESTIFSLDEFHLMVAVGALRGFGWNHHVGLT